MISHMLLHSTLGEIPLLKVEYIPYWGMQSSIHVSKALSKIGVLINILKGPCRVHSKK